jgi:hypothetical protein
MTPTAKRMIKAFFMLAISLEGFRPERPEEIVFIVPFMGIRNEFIVSQDKSQFKGRLSES